MKFRVLGSGGWEGCPSPFCKCSVCKAASKDPESKDFRFRPCFEVTAPKGKFLIECPPDIRLISQKFSLPPITDYLISHWHFDHAYGLLEMDAWSKRNPITVGCSQKTNDWISRAFGHINMKVNVLKPFQKIELLGATVTPFPVYHMRSQDDKLPEDQLNNTFGFLIKGPKKSLAYMADFYRVPEKSLKLIKGVDILVTDGTCLFEDVDPDHLHRDDVVKQAEDIGPKETYLHSLSHLYKKTHSEIAKSLPKGVKPTWDGLTIEL